MTQALVQKPFKQVRLLWLHWLGVIDLQTLAMACLELAHSTVWIGADAEFDRAVRYGPNDI